jgi:hypothetical protein
VKNSLNKIAKEPYSHKQDQNPFFIVFCISLCCLFFDFSSPTLYHFFFNLILLQVVHLKLEENVFTVVYAFVFNSHTRVHYFYGTQSRLQLLNIAKTRFGGYVLTSVLKLS